MLRVQNVGHGRIWGAGHQPAAASRSPYISSRACISSLKSGLDPHSNWTQSEAFVRQGVYRKPSHPCPAAKPVHESHRTCTNAISSRAEACPVRGLLSGAGVSFRAEGSEFTVEGHRNFRFRALLHNEAAALVVCHPTCTDLHVTCIDTIRFAPQQRACSA